MKKFLFVLSIGLLFFSCKKDEKEEVKPKSEACFNYIPDNDFKIGDTLKFTSCSQNATIYKWDFGDGKYSNDSITKHTYSISGSFKVKLIASNEYSSDTLIKTIKIREWTKNELISATTWSAYLLQDQDQKIEIPNKDSEFLYLTFLNDGTFISAAKSEGIVESNKGKWTLSDAAIILILNNEKEIWNIKELTSQKLTIEFQGILIFFKPKV